MGLPWSWIIAGIAVALLAAYIGFLRLDNSHLKADLEKSQAAHALYVQEVTATNNALKQSADAITLKYKEALVAQNKAIEATQVAIQQRIKSDETLKAVILSADAVSVFNDGKQATSQPQPEGTTATQSSNDGKGNTTQAAGSASNATNGPTAQPQFSLASLLAVVKENEANQNKCVDELDAWQSFWLDFSNGVEKVGG